jgi:hypothetical protein
MSFLPLPDITLTGSTPGFATGESVELLPHFTLTDNESFTLQVRVAASGIISGAFVSQSFIRRFCVRRDSGVTTIVASNTLDQLGDAGASSWTVTASVGSSPDRFALTFTTGSTQAYTSVRADIQVTRSIKPGTAPPVRSFVQVWDLFYDSTNDNMWIGDPNLSNPDIPVFQAATRSPKAVVNATSASWTTGATRIIGDGTYIYASNWFQKHILIIDPVHCSIIGIANLSTGFGGYDLASDGTHLYAISLSGNIIYRFTISSVISSYPTPASPDANTTVSRDFRGIVWDPNDSLLWAGCYVSSSQAVLVQLTSALSESSVTTYSIDTNPTTEGVFTYHGCFADSSVWFCIGHGNFNAPNYNFDSTPGSVLRDLSTFIFLSASAPAPASGLPAPTAISYDPYHDTVLAAMLNGNSYGAQNIWRIAASSNTQASIFGNAGVNGRAYVAAAEPLGLWVGQYDFSPAKGHIDIYSTGIGTESFLATITQY